jgi:tetratricopeptide (TPR) repeat protein
MAKTKRQPTNEPGRYDAARVGNLKPIHQAIERLRLPPIRFRKLNAVCNALEMQIEDGGDAPEVNNHLLAALRLMVIHQVGQQRAGAMLQAIDDFARVEEVRWEHVQTETLPPPEMEPDEELDKLMQTGYELLSAHQTTNGCDHWLLAWEQVKKLAAPTMRRVEAFDDAYPGLLQSVFNWSHDLEMELHNVGFSNSIYFERRIRYVHEYLAQFPDDDVDRRIAFRRAEGEALWQLGRKAESETIYQELITTFPDRAWGYIGWSDQYYMWRDSPGDYKRAEAILNQALTRPKLDDRHSVQERLAGLAKRQEKAGQKSKPATKQQAKKQRRKFRSGRKKRRKK